MKLLMVPENPAGIEKDAFREITKAWSAEECR
jgi:hypothetical protein